MLPEVSTWQLRWFTRYVTYYLRRNFHAVRLLRIGRLERLDGRALLVCLNHPSWWDPLIGLYLSRRLFPGRVHVSPMEAAALGKYKLFERLGFFGIDPAGMEGAKRFLTVGSDTLARPDGAFWVTAQGRFTDVRQRPVQLRAGVGHLARRASGFAMLPIALEYAFWNERYPEAFAAIGEPILVDSGAAMSEGAWTEMFASALERTQDVLSGMVAHRDAADFETLLAGSSGVGGIYDLWRGMRARILGRRFAPGHGGV